MASTQAVRRLQKELVDMQKNPTPLIEALPDHNNILTWYFIIDGPPDSFYEGGEFLGRIQFPSNYPFAPPEFYFATPTGRFQTDTSICLSYSAHHKDTWSPMWTTPKMLQGLLSFMLESAKALGTMETDEKTKRILAKKSLEFNVRNPKYAQLFPQRMASALAKLARQPEGFEFLDKNRKTFPSMVLPVLEKVIEETKKEMASGATNTNANTVSAGDNDSAINKK